MRQIEISKIRRQAINNKVLSKKLKHAQNKSNKIVNYLYIKPTIPSGLI